MPALENVLKDFQTYTLIFGHAGEKYTGSTVNIVQADNKGRKLAFDIRNFNISIDATNIQGYFSYQHSTEDIVQGTVLCDYNQNERVFEVTLPTTMSEFGTYTCDFALRAQDGSVLSTRPFAIFVERSALKISAVYSSQNFTLFMNAISQIDNSNNAINKLLEERKRAVDEALSKAQTDLGKQQTNFNSKLVEWNKKVDDAIARVLAKGDLTKAQADSYYIKKETAAVQSSYIAPNAVTTEKLNANSVTSEKIMQGAVNGLHFAAGSIGLAALAPSVGVIVEYQQNARGCAIKYSNGVMICSGYDTISGGAVEAWGSVYCSKQAVLCTFLVPFVSTPFCIMSQQSGSACNWIALTGNPTTTRTQAAYVCRPNGFEVTGTTISYIAIGRWK